MKLKEFVEQYGQPFSEMLGIDLETRRNEEIVKWFLASVLYGKPIRESSATSTYRVFEEKGVLSASRILQCGWEGIVSILDEGTYTRYDFSTARRLLEIFGNLEKNYGGDLNRLHASAKDSKDLELRLKALGTGIGDTTVSIFLRDMRGIWDKANPKPSPMVILAMKELGIKDLEKTAKAYRLNVVRLETSLLRLGKDFLKKNKKLEIEMR
ncbi:MAG TPA: hypothetical protein VFF30_19770 [Nitrososphaerales archaeon]|nr:hypothetical protein [Nitrososphaerales archaeon]